jgi:GT2 family glycosyltransferase
MTVPPLSVILPVHNGMPYVGDSVASLLAQSFADFELLIGDDGSDDGGSALLRGEAERDRRIRLLRRERPSGLAASQNWLASEARAPLIAVAHADDLSYPDRLRRQVDIFAAEPDVDLVGTLWDGIDERGRRVRPGDWWRLVRRSPFAPFSHSSAMFRRASFERAGGYRPEAEYWEDLDLYYRIAATGRVVVVPQVLAAVRHARISTRLRQKQEKVEEAVDLMYRSTAEYRRGRDHTPLLLGRGRGSAGRRLHPLTFVSCGSTNLWSGRRPGVMRRMWARARLRPDSATLHAIAWIAWGTASPRSLRLFLRTLMQARNLIAKAALGRPPFVDWPPRRRSRQAVSQAAATERLEAGRG